MYATNISNLTNNRRKVKVDIQSDVSVTELPQNGAGVSNLADDVTFEVGSTLFVVPTAEAYMYGEDGDWHLVGEEA